MAPAVLQQKPEDALLAAKMLAAIVLSAGAEPSHRDSAAGNWLSTLPPPFHKLQCYCVINATRKDGQPTEETAARSKWLGDSYRLLMASALGKHPRFTTLCPPNVYSRCFGMIDCNAASTMAISASQLHAALAGVPCRHAGTSADAATGARAEGVGLYPFFSFANHSCEPNAVNAKGIEDGDASLDCRLVLRAVRPIATDEEICFDYLDLAHSLSKAGGLNQVQMFGVLNCLNTLGLLALAQRARPGTCGQRLADRAQRV
eukprot:CAMPEP_0115858868 /NCGR_PEP_ID=MMETSP0287-20121206/16319_1 /TAXON_ID=412157 /ORGANISM="Chrysochromulina rotalis, Strain UIO044" /LENGTH=259 /DNA_ID=CAMNT_0003313145 /DNA_START=377 /DNA_END=1157 /DNA_ORIENTATION=+